MNKINVTSEIKPLKKVLLHRPGNELLNLTPNTLGDLLFDDIPYLPVAQREHDEFARVLKENGIEVVYLEKLMAEVLALSDEIREEFIKQFPYKGYSIYCSFYRFLRNASLELQMEETVNVNDYVEKCEKEMNEQMKLIEIICFFIEEIPNFLIENEKEDLLWYIEYKKHW